MRELVRQGCIYGVPQTTEQVYNNGLAFLWSQNSIELLRRTDFRKGVCKCKKTRLEVAGCPPHAEGTSVARHCYLTIVFSGVP